ncbi:MAG: hypothetical protein R3E77_16740 [Steroidobacteraceae bacterium]
MRLLFDQGTPVPLRAHLTKHEVSTVFELGWSSLANGELLGRAESAGYAGFVTTDQNLKYQQNLPNRRIAVAVLLTTSWPRIERHAAVVVAELDKLTSGAFVEIEIP